MKPTLLAVDLSYQSYRASAAHPKLSSHGRFTGGVYGFFATLGKQVRETAATQIVICTDTKPYVRSREFPDYKMLRAKNANEELRAAHKETMGYLADVFDELGIPVWSEPGFESDDLIGHIVARHRHRFRRIVAASNDSDLYQLMWHPEFYVMGSDWDKVQSGTTLSKSLGVTPAEHMLATALSGTHNDLPGIPKVGPGRSLAAIKNPGVLRKYREEHGDLIDRNLRLIKLPHDDFPRSARIPIAARAFNSRALYRALGRFDIEVTASMVNALERVLP